MRLASEPCRKTSIISVSNTNLLISDLEVPSADWDRAAKTMYEAKERGGES